MHVWVTFTFTNVSVWLSIIIVIFSHYYRFLSLVIELSVTQSLTDPNNIHVFLYNFFNPYPANVENMVSS